jgi:hypothetical protein
VIRQVTVGAYDRQIIEAIIQAEKAGIDCPPGWPEKFIAFISTDQYGAGREPEDVAGRLWRRTLAFRVTDEMVRDEVGLVPLYPRERPQSFGTHMRRALGRVLDPSGCPAAVDQAPRLRSGGSGAETSM